MKKVLITGSSGYIGSHLCKLLESEYEVHGLDYREPQVEVDQFYTVDITKIFEIENIEYDAVIHLAALVNVGESEQRPISYYITNLNGTMNVLNKIKTKNFIFASTGQATLCINPYSISKRAAEDVVRSFCTMKDIEYTTFRFYNVLGSTVVPPTNPDGIFHNLITAIDKKEFTILGTDYDTPDGTCIRDYVHVNEICHAIKLAIEEPSNQIECLGHGKGMSVKDLVALFQRVNNVEFNVVNGPRRKGDPTVSVLDHVSAYMKNLYTLDQLLLVS